MPDIVAVAPIDETFSITWMISSRCNYDCMYCAPSNHNNLRDHLTLPELQQAWVDIYTKSHHLGLRYKLCFTGGEVTTNLDFIEFVAWLRSNYSDKIHSLLVTTNGSASSKYYISIYQYIDNISFSVHSEHIDEQRYFAKMAEIKAALPAGKVMFVNIMNEFWNTSRIPKYTAILDSLSIPHSLNDIHYGHKTRMYPIMKGELNLE